MKKLTALDWTALVLLIVGGLNWLLIGIFNFDLVGKIFGDMSWFSRLIYIIVGMCAIYIGVIAGNLEKKQM
jgi:uncharacterized membrane protein YuzA (DUF378 family)